MWVDSGEKNTFSLTHNYWKERDEKRRHVWFLLNALFIFPMQSHTRVHAHTQTKQVYWLSAVVFLCNTGTIRHFHGYLSSTFPRNTNLFWPFWKRMLTLYECIDQKKTKNWHALMYKCRFEYWFLWLKRGYKYGSPAEPPYVHSDNGISN